MSDPYTFHGSKLAILVHDQIVVLLRDDIPTIPWPGYWDLPGGAREGGEDPKTCALRETEEELGIQVPRDSIIWGGGWPSPPDHVWFYVSESPEFDPARVRFGQEGQRWALAPITWYLSSARGIPHQRRRLRAYLASRDRILAAVVRT